MPSIPLSFILSSLFPLFFCLKKFIFPIFPHFLTNESSQSSHYLYIIHIYHHIFVYKHQIYHALNSYLVSTSSQTNILVYIYNIRELNDSSLAQTIQQNCPTFPSLITFHSLQHLFHIMRFLMPFFSHAKQLKLPLSKNIYRFLFLFNPIYFLYCWILLFLYKLCNN